MKQSNSGKAEDTYFHTLTGEGFNIKWCFESITVCKFFHYQVVPMRPGLKRGLSEHRKGLWEMSTEQELDPRTVGQPGGVLEETRKGGYNTKRMHMWSVFKVEARGVFKRQKKYKKPDFIFCCFSEKLISLLFNASLLTVFLDTKQFYRVHGFFIYSRWFFLTQLIVNS